MLYRGEGNVWSSGLGASLKQRGEHLRTGGNQNVRIPQRGAVPHTSPPGYHRAELSRPLPGFRARFSPRPPGGGWNFSPRRATRQRPPAPRLALPLDRAPPHLRGFGHRHDAQPPRGPGQLASVMQRELPRNLRMRLNMRPTAPIALKPAAPPHQHRPPPPSRNIPHPKRPPPPHHGHTDPTSTPTSNNPNLGTPSPVSSGSVSTHQVTRNPSTPKPHQPTHRGREGG